MSLGDELSRLRRAAGTNRDTLAEAVGVSKGYLALLEQGHRRPSGTVIERMADRLGLDSTDRSRLHVRAFLDRLADEVTDLTPADFHVIEGVADALLLFAADPEGHEDVAETLAIGTRKELRLKAARQISHVLGRVAERWRDTELLTMPDYFRAIIAAMDAADLETVTAINTIDPRRWIEDQREVKYLESNSRAVGRGASIRRLFLIDSSVRRRDLLRVARAHEIAGIAEVRWLRTKKVSHLADIPEDAVLFENGGHQSLYIGHADPEDVLRVEFGEKVINLSEIQRFRQFFDLLFHSASLDIGS
jgi:transcriptional regulator with XRE-family HTH domain